MSKITVRSIGPAEREIVRLLISDISIGDRNNARMARTIRRQFDLRGLTQTMEMLIGELQDEIIESLSGEPSSQIIAGIIEALDEKPSQQVITQIVNTLSQRPSPQAIANVRRNVNAGNIPWGTLLEAGYYSIDEKEVYGENYGVDKTTLEWLNDRRAIKVTWTWRANLDGSPKLDAEGERIPGDVPSEMLDAIATLDEAIAQALL